MFQFAHDFWFAKTTHTGFAVILSTASLVVCHQITPLHGLGIIAYALFKIWERDTNAQTRGILALPEADRAKLFKLIDETGS